MSKKKTEETDEQTTEESTADTTQRCRITTQAFRLRFTYCLQCTHKFSPLIVLDSILKPEYRLNDSRYSKISASFVCNASPRACVMMILPSLSTSTIVGTPPVT